ncbi:transporter family-2 protein [Algoriphagus sp. 4150]|uniref:DMT family transporter n=1 Tax=Algoriphagus sp. 4150 TaxID=2817756 RepID=UPI002859DD35|nr:DMT family transporter [Algoriphagus sp. 4150]MDR7128958.1 transporter family-2 protein [Algoriphagus sp. 4150]
MNQSLLSIIAFIGGVCLAIQAGFNTQLGVLVKKPILASISTSISGVLFAFVFVMLFSKDIPNIQTAKQVPWYLWFTGGLFSIIGITLYYFTIPKLGISKMISMGLCGQLVFSVVAGHFGWLDLPLEPITLKKMIGVSAMILGIAFINSN